jgi:hypothetical protein
MAAKKGNAADRAAPARTAPKAAPKATQAPKPPKAPAISADAMNAGARAEISAEELRQLISEAAYYRAKQRGFEPGHELEDWIQAEAEVIRRLNAPGRPA